MSKLFWTSAASARGRAETNLERSLLEGVPLEVLGELGLDASQLARMGREGRVRFWGTTASAANRRKWEGSWRSLGDRRSKLKAPIRQTPVLGVYIPSPEV
jgi:hypothetical protein